MRMSARRARADSARDEAGRRELLRTSVERRTPSLFGALFIKYQARPVRLSRLSVHVVTMNAMRVGVRVSKPSPAVGRLVALTCFALAACRENRAVPSAAPSGSVSAGFRATNRPLNLVPRPEFNRVSSELMLPIFWADDKNANGGLDPDELAVFWGVDPNARLADYVVAHAFTPTFSAAYEKILKRREGSFTKPPDAKEAARRAAVVKELAQGRPTLVATDLSAASPEERRFVGLVLKAAQVIERLYAKQLGNAELKSKVPADDPASQMLFFRSQGPDCEAPLTRNDPSCSAIPDLDRKKRSGLYPSEWLDQTNFCEELTKRDKALMDPFVVVRGDVKQPKAVPYTIAFAAEMQEIAEELRAASEALGEKEPALKTYVSAAAQSFADNHWWPADEAWAKMSATNSKYYLRIGPDETYDEPCNAKALFHLSFGLVNQGSLTWQGKLEPLRDDMESSLAELAGPPYKPRKVTFKLPDFVDIALNAGNSRAEFGATVGQSLPNFGPVANEGRGRTIAMTGFYTDPDSVRSARQTAESLFCGETMAKYSSDPKSLVISTVLHEAAHNLGPSHQYKAHGKIDRESFGGPLASTLEELKAQTAALYFLDWLVEKKQLERDHAKMALVGDVYWAFGHISRGMYNSEQQPNSYSHLAAIQLGWLIEHAAVTWKANDSASNAKDKGCFEIVFDEMPRAAESLMREVAQIKSRGDRGRAQKLVDSYVDVTGEKKSLHELITERVLREPKATFVYSLQL